MFTFLICSKWRYSQDMFVEISLLLVTRRGFKPLLRLALTTFLFFFFFCVFKSLFGCLEKKRKEMAYERMCFCVCTCYTRVSMYLCISMTSFVFCLIAEILKERKEKKTLRSFALFISCILDLSKRRSFYA